MVVICRFGELFLKGKNRPSFVRALAGAVTAFLAREGIRCMVRATHTRLLLETPEHCLFLRRVFGITSFSPARACPADTDAICAHACELLGGRSARTFRVSTQRLTKENKLTSPQMNALLGEAIARRLGLQVELKQPDAVVGVEILDGVVYVFVESFPGAGGLPPGTAGTVIQLFDGDFAELSALLLMKRGCRVICAGFKELHLPLVERFASAPPVFVRIGSLPEVAALAERFGALAVATGNPEPAGLSALSLNSAITLPILAPVVGKDLSTLRQLQESYEHLC